MKLRYFLILAAILGIFAHDGRAQGTPQCNQSFHFTGSGVAPIINTTAGSTNGCVGWRLTFRVTGFTAAEIEIDGSQDGITFAAIDSTLVQEGVNPTNWTSATVSNTIVVRAYLPFIQVNLVSVTGSGSLNTLMLGYVGTSAQSDAGNTVGGITALNGDVSATGPGSVPAFVQGIEGTPFCTGFTPVQGSLVQYTINSAPNPCWEEVPPNTSGIQKFLSQTGLSGVAGEANWQPAPSAAALTYYLTNTASDVATYLQQTTLPYSPKTTLTYSALPNGASTIQNWATNAGVPNLSFIPAGAYTCHLHILKSPFGSATIACEFVEVNAAGVDIGVIGTTDSITNPAQIETQYTLDFADGNVYTLASTSSRIVCRVIATAVTGAPNIQIFVGGTADSHMSLPSNTVDASNFVPYVGAVKNVNLGAFGETAASVTAGSTVIPLWYDIRAYGAKCDGSTDDTAALNSAFAAVYVAGGGTIMVPHGTGDCLVLGQITIPYNAADLGHMAIPRQPAYRLTGMGGTYKGTNNGLVLNDMPEGGSTLNLQYNAPAGYAKLYTVGSGLLEIDHLTLKDSASDCAPFLKTINTSLNVYADAFIGTAFGSSACNDAIIMGGTDNGSNPLGILPTSPFQGYISTVHENYFGQIRRVVTGLNYYNGNTIANNYIASSCGSATANDAAIMLDPGNTLNVWGENVTGNYVEVENYDFAFYCGSGCQNGTFVGNTTQDNQCVVGPTVFTGSGLNDAVSSGTCLGLLSDTSTYTIIVDGTGTPNTFKWKVSNSVNAGSFTAGVAITGAPQTLQSSSGAAVKIGFASTTGHTLGDQWVFIGKVAGAYWIGGVGNVVIPARDDARNGTEIQGPQAPAKSFNNGTTGIYLLTSAPLYSSMPNVNAVTGQVNTLQTAPGSAAKPAHSFYTADNNGFYFNGTSSAVEYSYAGSGIMGFLNTGLVFRTNVTPAGVRWVTGNVGGAYVYQTGIDQTAAATVKITDGSTGTGTLIFKPPTSCTGLATGTLWNNVGILAICP